MEYLSGCLRIDQLLVYVTLAPHHGLHGASLRSISFDAHETSCRYELADIHPEAFRDVRAGVPKLLHPGSTTEPYLFFSQGRPATGMMASTLRSGGAPPQNYLSGLFFIDTVLHSINPDANCGI